MPPNHTRRIAVLGAGAWGTALANLAARPGGKDEAEVTLWARDPAHVAEMTATGVNARYLPGVPLLSNVRPSRTQPRPRAQSSFSPWSPRKRCGRSWKFSRHMWRMAFPSLFAPRVSSTQPDVS